jgi:hypothetical protein|tara:strand:+ start:249 stop:473 length:225 start_codon:yes stop_codon:yes gene_type:complete
MLSDNKYMFALKPIITRPSVRVQAGKNEAPVPKMHPLKKFIMETFKIEEIDYDKFKKDNKWAIRPDKKKKGDKE